MNNRYQASYSSMSSQVPFKTLYEDLPETTQYITFGLSGYRFAIASDEVLKVVMTPEASQGGLVDLGLVQLGPYSIQILDLPSLLSLERAGERGGSAPSVGSSRELEGRKVARHSTQTQKNSNPPFLVVLQDSSEELWGIALHEPPDLIEVPDYALKPVPAKKRLLRSLRWISHIVNYDLNRDRHSLLVLDLAPAFAPRATEFPVVKNASTTV